MAERDLILRLLWRIRELAERVAAFAGRKAADRMVRRVTGLELPPHVRRVRTRYGDVFVDDGLADAEASAADQGDGA